MSKRHLNILISPAFVVALCLLIANDFLLKPLFHNWFTGKLSDFAGLFVFPLFWAMFFPCWRKQIYLLTFFSFIFWKSEFSQPFIDWWNAFRFLKIERVVDFTDLFALLVLPFSFLYSQKCFNNLKPQLNFNYSSWFRRLATCFMCAFSLFAFTATSAVDDQSAAYYKDYEFDAPKEELIKRLGNIGLRNVSHHRLPDYFANLPNRAMSEEERNLYQIVPSVKFCKSSLYATATFYERGAKTIMKLEYVGYSCDTHEPEHNQQILEIFEREVFDKLRTNTAMIRLAKSIVII